MACNGPTTPYGDLQDARASTGLQEFDYGTREYSSNGSLEAMHALVQRSGKLRASVRTQLNSPTVADDDLLDKLLSTDGKAQVLTLPEKRCSRRRTRQLMWCIRESIAVSYSAGAHDRAMG